jgi:pimeloyl-ACP methyl ester carboxylesterase
MVSHLGPKRFYFYEREVARTDFVLLNNQGQKLQCSMWEHMSPLAPAVPCVIYLHGNSSSRVEALGQLTTVLRMGCSYLAFDTAGSGMSDGNYVSLGYFEREDLASVIEHLREAGKTSTIALWGRSMGAATALLHAERDPSIAAMVLDSAFADLVMLAQDMVEKGRGQGLFAPGFVISLALRWIRQSVQKRAKFDINDLSPIKHADKCYIPAQFVAGEQDDFIHPDHSHKIYNKYSGDKNIILVQGGHNSPRPAFMHDSVSIFLHRALLIPDEWGPPAGDVDNYQKGIPPWHIRTGAYRAAPRASYLPSTPPSGSRNQFPSHNITPGKDLDHDQHPIADEDLEAVLADLEARGLGQGGMTAERQAEVEGALASMLGGAGASVGHDEAIRMMEWACPMCTLVNRVPSGSSRTCTMCEHTLDPDFDSKL